MLKNRSENLVLCDRRRTDLAVKVSCVLFMAALIALVFWLDHGVGRYLFAVAGGTVCAVFVCQPRRMVVFDHRTKIVKAYINIRGIKIPQQQIRLKDGVILDKSYSFGEINVPCLELDDDNGRKINLDVCALQGVDSVRQQVVDWLFESGYECVPDEKRSVRGRIVCRLRACRQKIL